MGVTPSVGQLGPDADKASRFEPGPESEHALATGAAPALKPGVDDHSVRRFDGTAADGRAGIAGLPITHPLAVAADRPNDGGDLAGPGTGHRHSESYMCLSRSNPMIPPRSGEIPRFFQKFRQITKMHAIRIQKTTRFQQVENSRVRHTRTTLQFNKYGMRGALGKPTEYQLQSN